MRLIQGEEIMLTRNGKDFARLVPVAPKLPKSKQGKKKDTVVYASGDAPLEHFDIPLDDHTEIAEAPLPENIHRTTYPPLGSTQVMEGKPTATEVKRSFCEAPFANCKIEGELYEVEFWSDGEIKKKKVYLCPGHAYKAKQSSESVKKI